MINKCPKCERKIEKKRKKCPSCGYFFTKKDEKKSESKTQLSLDEKNRTDDLKNYPIEWSQFKDMSIGNVMKIFNSLQEENESAEKAETSDPALKNTSEVSDLKENDVTVISELHDSKPATPCLEPQKPDTKEQDSLPSEKTLPLKNTEQDGAKTNEEKIDLIDDTIQEKKEISEKMKKNDVPMKHENEKNEHSTLLISSVSSDQTSTKNKEKNKKNTIEMDSAPIFFKEEDELPVKPNSVNVFEQSKPRVEDPTEVAEEKQVSEKLTQAEKSKLSTLSQKSPLAKETTQQRSKTESLPNPAKKNYKKISFFVVASTFLIGGIWVYNQVKHQQTSQIQATEKAEKQEKLAETIQTSLEEYFTDDQQRYIKKDRVNTDLTAIKKELDTLSDKKNYKELYTMYDSIVKKQAAIKQVNALFVAPHLVEDQLVDVAIKEDKAIDIALYEEDDEFHALINQAIKNAQEQYNTLKTAKQSVEVFYTNNEINDQLTRENYTVAKNNVEKIKNENLRVSLDNKLKTADSHLVAQETALAAQKVQEEQAANQVEEVPKSESLIAYAEPDKTTFSQPNADGVYTEPVYSVIASDVADTGNPAWIWADGIQEQVIATCRQRGYITDNNYSLQPARIIDGQGYYNLYGANNQYLVTINNKTGWFKGNASRNAAKSTLQNNNGTTN